MWLFVWMLQGLVASTVGVYLNSPCIRSLLKCAPFQLSLSEGKFSNSFIEDLTTLERQCRSVAPLLECMQEAVLGQCSLKISPAEEEFIKTRLFIVEICKDVNYTQKAYLRNAACINAERDWVFQACNPNDYVEMVNASHLISLQGSCLFQELLIGCRQRAIENKCGPDAADLYRRVKEVDLNLDFLCMEGRDLQSPKFMLDVVINSYISLLLETLRPVMIMESIFLKDIEDNEEETPIEECLGKDCLLKKRIKRPATETEYTWRRFGDIPLELSEGSHEDAMESSKYSIGDPTGTIAQALSNPDTTSTDVETAVTDSETEDSSIFETRYHDLKETENAEFVEVEGKTRSVLNELLDEVSTGISPEFEQMSTLKNDFLEDSELHSDETTEIYTTNLLYDLKDSTLDSTDAFDTTSTEATSLYPSDFETTETSTAYPSYLESTTSDLSAFQETSAESDAIVEETVVYSKDDVTTIYGLDTVATLHSSEHDSIADLDTIQETTTLYPSDGYMTTTSESDGVIIETTTSDPDDSEVIGSDSDERNIFHAGSTPEASSESFSKESISDASSPATTLDFKGYKKTSPPNADDNLETEITESDLLEEKVKQSLEEMDFKELYEFYQKFGKNLELEIVSSVLRKLVNMFLSHKFEKRSAGFFTMKEADVEEVTHHSTSGEEATDKITHYDEDEEKTKEKPVVELVSIESIVKLGAHINYILIGESYIPLEIGYVEGKKEKFHRQTLEVPKRKFKIFYSTPTELPMMDYLTTESISVLSNTEEAESFLFEEESDSHTEFVESSCLEKTQKLPIENCLESGSTNEETESFPTEENLDSQSEFPEFSCPELTGNRTPRTSHLIDLDQDSITKENFRISEAEPETSEGVDEAKSTEETNQEFRRRVGDAEEAPEKINPRDLDMETIIALKYYGDVLMELAAMLPPDTPDSKTLTKRASSLMDVDESKRFQERSGEAYSETISKRPTADSECRKTVSSSEGAVRFDIGYSPESYIRIEMFTAADEKEVPDVRYMVVGESKLPLELHFSHKNQNYVHYTEMTIPKKIVTLEENQFKEEFLDAIPEDKCTKKNGSNPEEI